MSFTIGLTYDLRDDYRDSGLTEEQLAELDSLETIVHLESALSSLGYLVDRIGRMESLVAQLAAGRRWDLVFNISEGLFGKARESQIPSVLDAFEIPYTFSDPLVLALCLDKGITKVVLQHHKIPTPRFITAPVGSALQPQDVTDLLFPLFAKPIAEGTSKGVSTISRCEDFAELQVTCGRLHERYGQAVLIEEFLPGREFTVGLLGSDSQTTALGALEITYREGADHGVYTFINKEQCESLIEYRLLPSFDPLHSETIALAISAWQALGCQDGGRVDIRCDRNNKPQVIEINPLAGLHPTHSDLPMLATACGLSYVDLIGRIVESARSRARSPEGSNARIGRL